MLFHIQALQHRAMYSWVELSDELEGQVNKLIMLTYIDTTPPDSLVLAFSTAIDFGRT